MDAWHVQRDIFLRMSGSQRVAMACEMSDSARALTEAGIRHRHPDWTDSQILDAMLERLLGAELARKVRMARLVPA
jgi:hypothetical protein